MMKFHKSMASFLPDEIIIEILSCLPVKSLFRFKCVCKSWFDLFKNSSFAQLHLQRATQNGNFNLMSTDDGHVYSIDYNDIVVSLSPPADDEVEQITYPFYSPRIKFLSYPSCNGLFYLNIDIIPDPEEPHSYEINCLWNPATKESEEIPHSYNRYDESYGSLSSETYGFGYDYKTEVYKVVSIVYYFRHNDDVLSIVKVYTLGSNSWRRIGGIPYRLTYVVPGIYVNGALHWVAKRGYKKELSSEEVIVSLDLGDEEYRELPQPEYSDGDFGMTVSALEGCLSLICTNIHKNHVDLWMMREYGVKKSWNKLFTITIAQPLSPDDVVSLTPIKILKNGEILLNTGGLKVYDPTNKQLRGLKIQGSFCSLPQFDAVAYVGSLISLMSNDTPMWEASFHSCRISIIGQEERAVCLCEVWGFHLQMEDCNSDSVGETVIMGLATAYNERVYVFLNIIRSKSVFISVIQEKEPAEREVAYIQSCGGGT